MAEFDINDYLRMTIVFQDDVTVHEIRVWHNRFLAMAEQLTLNGYDIIANHCAWTPGRKAQHVDNPHEPGRLYDCPACEDQCHCVESSTQCVFTGAHNGKADEGSETHGWVPQTITHAPMCTGIHDATEECSR
jgi:hypothetical protein